MTDNIIIQTTAPSRTIKQCIQALYKSKTVSHITKLPYAKSYIQNENNRISTENIQLLIITPTSQREQSAHKILDNILKNRKLSNFTIQ